MGPERDYDVCEYEFKDGANSGQAEYWNTGDLRKFEAAALIIPYLKWYDAYAFFDDDLEAGTMRLNELFQIGMVHGWNVWQPGIVGPTTFSFLRRQACFGFRPIHMVECQCPFFSRAALDACLPTFTETQSGWGIDRLWPYFLAPNPNMAVVDCYPVRHTRPLTWGRGVTMPNGMTPAMEFEKVKIKWAAKGYYISDFIG
jgi:hypothetical protein